MVASVVLKQQRTEESINAAVIQRSERLRCITWMLCAASFTVTEKGSPVWFCRSFWPPSLVSSGAFLVLLADVVNIY